MNKKKQPWVRRRHKILLEILRPLIGTYTKWKYGIKVDPFREENGRQYLVVMNHQTAFDQFFISMAFRQPVYFIASEDLFSMGWVSRLIEWIAAPIPIKKQTTDLKAMRMCMTVAKEGGTIALAPEGNRTFSGRTGYFNPAIIKMVKMLKLPLAIFRIEGGYGTQPRWSDVIRRGKMRSYVSEVIEPEEYAAMTNGELMDRIEKGLYVDESNDEGVFRHKKRAEYLERAIYACPVCGLAPQFSRGSVVSCTVCGRQVTYRPDKRLEGIGWAFPYPSVADWYAYQEELVNHLDPDDHTEMPLFCDAVSLWDVQPYQRKTCLRKLSAAALYGDRIAIDEDSSHPLVLPFEEMTACAVLGRNKLNVYHNGNVYQFRGDKHFNALKYVHLYHRHKNVRKGEPYEQFLGL